MKNIKQTLKVSIKVGEKFLLLFVGTAGMWLVSATDQSKYLEIGVLVLSTVCLLTSLIPMWVAYVKANIPKK